MKTRDEAKVGNIITCIAFPAIITYMLKLDNSGYLTISYTLYFNFDSLIECRFFRGTKGNGPLDPDVYLWKLEYIFGMRLLIYVPLSFDDDKTWRMEIINISTKEW
jgi:hypothetical protein